MTTDPNKSTSGMVSDAMAHVSSLVRNEVDLARAEISENLSRAGVALGLLVGAIVLALTALNVLSAALISALTEVGLDAGWAALIVGAGLAVIAFAMMAKGLNDLKLSSLAPSRTAENVRRDAKAVKEAYDAK